MARRTKKLSSSKILGLSSSSLVCWGFNYWKSTVLNTTNVFFSQCQTRCRRWSVWNKSSCHSQWYQPLDSACNYKEQMLHWYEQFSIWRASLWFELRHADLQHSVGGYREWPESKRRRPGERLWKDWKASFEKTLFFSALASKLNMGFNQQGLISKIPYYSPPPPTRPWPPHFWNFWIPLLPYQISKQSWFIARKQVNNWLYFVSDEGNNKINVTANKGNNFNVDI